MHSLRAATAAATRAFGERKVASGLPSQHFRVLNGLLVSSVGIGTYLGDDDDPTDAAYEAAIGRAVERGINFIDTAINYRYQRSERAVGRAIRKLTDAGVAKREELFVATKGGFVSYDTARPEDPAAWQRQHILEPGLATQDDIVQGAHCMTPAYLRNQIETSLANLGLDCIDLYYLHNPETQLQAVDRRDFLVRLQAAFVELERAVSDGKIRGYGVATWHGFRLDPEERQYLSVEEVVRLARGAVGAGGHHLCAIQLPFNVAMHEAYSFQNQAVAGDLLNTVDAANGRGLSVIASGALRQGALASELPPVLGELCPGLNTDAQRAIQFARSGPGITSALVGMSQRAHVDENTELLRIPPIDPDSIADLFRE